MTDDNRDAIEEEAGVQTPDEVLGAQDEDACMLNDVELEQYRCNRKILN
jgi:hypothetical protein